MYKLVIVCFLLVLFVSCEKYPADVLIALDKAGKNRCELEKVLDYYKNTDLLKYKSACYLIANMPYHNSRYEVKLDEKYDAYFRKTDSLYNLFFGGMTLDEVKNLRFRIPDSIRNKLSEEYDYISYPLYSKGEQDIETISSDFLIDNIEMAFRVWENTSMLKDMPFEEFKEFILPYRTSDECLLYKRSELYDRYFHQLAKDGMEKIHDPIEWYKLYVLKQQRISYYTNRTSNIGVYDLFLPSSEFNCHNQVTWTCNMFRACGIPVSYEFTPQWTDRENRHFWCVSPDIEGIYTPYSIPQNNIGEDWESNLKFAAKVYRRGFAANKRNAYFSKKKNECVPKALDFPTLKDESFRYRQTVSLNLPFNKKTKNNLAYLSFVTRSGLVPVAWGHIDKKRKTAFFEQVPINVVFILSYYRGNKIYPIGNPFILETTGDLNYIPKPMTRNTIINSCELKLFENKLVDMGLKVEPKNIKYRELVIDTTQKKTMHLLRKYPEKSQLQRVNKNIIGSLLLAFNKLNTNFDTLFVFQNMLSPNLQQINIENNKQYRYYRLETKDKSAVNISLIEFLAKKKNIHLYSYPTPLPVFNSNDISETSDFLFKVKGKPSENCLNAFDGNMETFVNAKSLQIEFQIPVKVEAIRIAPRNANNQIVVGDNYSLSYFNGSEWKEITIVKATYNFLSVENVPQNGLYLLKNLDNGKEEMPFLYEENKQRWFK